MKAPPNKISDPAISSMKRGQIPKYFEGPPKTSTADYWGQITFQFQDDCFWLNNWRIESKDEFLAKAVRTDRTIIYSSDEAVNELNELLFYTRSWVPKLEKLIARRKVTPKFLALWGTFNNNVGRISTHWSLTPDKTDALAGSKKSRKQTNKDQHRVWYSHAFLTLKARSPNLVRKQLDELVKRHILDLLDKKYLAKEGYGRDWFKGFFDNFLDCEEAFLKEKSDEPREKWHLLTAAFKDKKLSIKEMRRLSERHPVIFPDTNLN